MERTSPDSQPAGPMDAEEKYQNIFLHFVNALRILAMDPEPQCHAEGNYNVAQELQYEILSGRYVIGKGKLNELEETALAALASAGAAIPESALAFAEAHYPNVKNMKHSAWSPIRAQAGSLLALLGPRISENEAYFDKNGAES
jgi:hypothetical protein